MQGASPKPARSLDNNIVDRLRADVEAAIRQVKASQEPERRAAVERLNQAVKKLDEAILRGEIPNENR